MSIFRQFVYRIKGKDAGNSQETAPFDMKTDQEARRADATSERPIESREQDILERDRFVRRLVDALIDPRNGKATGIVVGITGPWGSGKSSILNLLAEELAGRYPNAICVRFEPWLISGRSELIEQFFADLGAELRHSGSERALKLANRIMTYAEDLSPILNLTLPGAGMAAKAGVRGLRKVIKRDDSLHTQRRRLRSQLIDLATPIVVLIDEVDRLEDDEVRDVAQLVRSVADFPGISYVLAYDVDRVIEALGGGGGDEARHDRGRAYIEKIVQIQIPLPITFDNEIRVLLEAELGEAIGQRLCRSESGGVSRFDDLLQVLIPDLIRTPRDVKRLAGVFRPLQGMVGTEVDTTDLLGYCTLLIKAPGTVEALRTDPDYVAQDGLTLRSVRGESQNEDVRFAALVPKGEDNQAIRSLLRFLFPSFQADRSPRRTENRDAICLRRPLLTVLRLGLPPGGWSLADIEALVSGSTDSIEARIREVYRKDAMGPLIDRLEELYPRLNLDHGKFWSAIGQVLDKEPGWMTSFVSTYEVIEAFCKILLVAVTIEPDLRTDAEKVFDLLKDRAELSLVPHWLRSHIFTYGLFGQERRERDAWFLERVDVERITNELCEKWREEHLSRNFLTRLWTLVPVFTMVNAGYWDTSCRDLLGEEISQDDTAVDGLGLMLFGGHYMVGWDVVERVCPGDLFRERSRARLAEPNALDPSVRTALSKMFDPIWAPQEAETNAGISRAQTS